MMPSAYIHHPYRNTENLGWRDSPQRLLQTTEPPDGAVHGSTRSPELFTETLCSDTAVMRSGTILFGLFAVLAVGNGHGRILRLPSVSSLYSARMVAGNRALKRSTSGLRKGDIAPPVPVFMMMPLDTVADNGTLSEEAVRCLPVSFAGHSWLCSRPSCVELKSLNVPSTVSVSHLSLSLRAVSPLFSPLPTHPHFASFSHNHSFNHSLAPSPDPPFVIQRVRDIGADGIMIDVWWGLCEKSPGEYNFQPYLDIMAR